MTAHSSETTTVRPGTPVNAQPLPQDVDYSCRIPLMFLFSASVFWLLISLLFGVLATVKMHAPGMLADVAALTFGRVAAASSSSFLYGFASQAGIAVALWLFARTGRTFLIFPVGALLGGIIWNVGVLLGIGGILGGGMNHFPAYEMPYWATPFFLVGFVLLGLSGLLTFVARNERELYPSTWFLFAAFFVFPWISAVAYLLLGRYEIRGILEPIVATWFFNNFVMLWLTPIALAILFYFISKLSQQPLRGYETAVFSFWLYILCAHASGFQNLVAVPTWMPTLSVVVNTLLALPIALIAYIWYSTWAGHNRAKKQKEASSKYIVFSAVGFVITGVFLLLLSYPAIDEVVGMTIFQNAASSWTFYAFIGMALFGAIVYIVPRLTEIDWPSPKLVTGHFALTAAGIVLVVLALALGGYVQGNAINNPQLPFSGKPGVVRQVIPYIGISTIGWLLILIGQVALLSNMALMFKSCMAGCCGFGSKEVAR
jgi:cytochrome c oxidase cbb3-type subunit I